MYETNSGPVHVLDPDGERRATEAYHRIVTETAEHVGLTEEAVKDIAAKFCESLEETYGKRPVLFVDFGVTYTPFGATGEPVTVYGTFHPATRVTRSQTTDSEPGLGEVGR